MLDVDKSRDIRDLIFLVYLISRIVTKYICKIRVSASRQGASPCPVQVIEKQDSSPSRNSTHSS